jgi:two-component system chemotaxis response regulator CheB
MIKVLIVDDSEVVCRILSSELSGSTDIEVVGTAIDPYMARDKIVALRPDVITLDLEMPRMDGLTFLRKLMCYYPLPVIVISSQTPEGSDTAVRALELGAVDVMGKPALARYIGELGKGLAERVRAAAAVRRVCPSASPSPLPPPRQPIPLNTAYMVCAMGASTGGTQAIKHLLRELPPDTPGMVIAQHMPAQFTAQFAHCLNSDCALEVREARSGDNVLPGVALIAPGDRHTVVCRRGSRYVVEIKDGPPIHHQRPSIDVLFHSVAACAGPEAVGVLLTGMGGDGARGLLAMRQAGARTFAQDEQSCVVFGMPKEAIRLDAAERVVSLERMSQCILDAISQKGPRQATPATACPAQV